MSVACDLRSADGAAVLVHEQKLIANLPQLPYGLLGEKSGERKQSEARPDGPCVHVDFSGLRPAGCVVTEGRALDPILA